jgi:hypothetical protein
MSVVVDSVAVSSPSVDSTKVEGEELQRFWNHLQSLANNSTRPVSVELEPVTYTMYLGAALALGGPSSLDNGAYGSSSGADLNLEKGWGCLPSRPQGALLEELVVEVILTASPSWLSKVMDWLIPTSIRLEVGPREPSSMKGAVDEVLPALGVSKKPLLATLQQLSAARPPTTQLRIALRCLMIYLKRSSATTNPFCHRQLDDADLSGVCAEPAQQDGTERCLLLFGSSTELLRVVGQCFRKLVSQEPSRRSTTTAFTRSVERSRSENLMKELCYFFHGAGFDVGVPLVSLLLDNDLSFLLSEGHSGSSWKDFIVNLLASLQRMSLEAHKPLFTGRTLLELHSNFGWDQLAWSRLCTSASAHFSNGPSPCREQGLLRQWPLHPFLRLYAPELLHCHEVVGYSRWLVGLWAPLVAETAAWNLPGGGSFEKGVHRLFLESSPRHQWVLWKVLYEPLIRDADVVVSSAIDSWAMQDPNSGCGACSCFVHPLSTNGLCNDTAEHQSFLQDAAWILSSLRWRCFSVATARIKLIRFQVLLKLTLWLLALYSPQRALRRGLGSVPMGFLLGSIRLCGVWSSETLQTIDGLLVVLLMEGIAEFDSMSLPEQQTCLRLSQPSSTTTGSSSSSQTSAVPLPWMNTVLHLGDEIFSTGVTGSLLAGLFLDWRSRLCILGASTPVLSKGVFFDTGSSMAYSPSLRDALDLALPALRLQGSTFCRFWWNQVQWVANQFAKVSDHSLPESLPVRLLLQMIPADLVKVQAEQSSVDGDGGEMASEALSFVRRLLLQHPLLASFVRFSHCRQARDFRSELETQIQCQRRFWASDEWFRLWQSPSTLVSGGGNPTREEVQKETHSSSFGSPDSVAQYFGVLITLINDNQWIAADSFFSLCLMYLQGTGSVRANATASGIEPTLGMLQSLAMTLTSHQERVHDIISLSRNISYGLFLCVERIQLEASPELVRQSVQCALQLSLMTEVEARLSPKWSPLTATTKLDALAHCRCHGAFVRQHLLHMVQQCWSDVKLYAPSTATDSSALRESVELKRDSQFLRSFCPALLSLSWLLAAERGEATDHPKQLGAETTAFAKTLLRDPGGLPMTLDWFARCIAYLPTTMLGDVCSCAPLMSMIFDLLCCLPSEWLQSLVAPTPSSAEVWRTTVFEGCRLLQWYLPDQTLDLYRNVLLMSPGPSSLRPTHSRGNTASKRPRECDDDGTDPDAEEVASSSLLERATETLGPAPASNLLECIHQAVRILTGREPAPSARPESREFIRQIWPPLIDLASSLEPSVSALADISKAVESMGVVFRKGSSALGSRVDCWASHELGDTFASILIRNAFKASMNKELGLEETPHSSAEDAEGMDSDNPRWVRPGWLQVIESAVAYLRIGRGTDRTSDDLRRGVITSLVSEGSQGRTSKPQSLLIQLVIDDWFAGGVSRSESKGAGESAFGVNSLWESSRGEMKLVVASHFAQLSIAQRSGDLAACLVVLWSDTFLSWFRRVSLCLCTGTKTVSAAEELWIDDGEGLAAFLLPSLLALRDVLRIEIPVSLLEQLELQPVWIRALTHVFWLMGQWNAERVPGGPSWMKRFLVVLRIATLLSKTLPKLSTQWTSLVGSLTAAINCLPSAAGVKQPAGLEEMQAILTGQSKRLNLTDGQPALCLLSSWDYDAAEMPVRLAQSVRSIQPLYGLQSLGTRPHQLLRNGRTFPAQFLLSHRGDSWATRCRELCDSLCVSTLHNFLHRTLLMDGEGQFERHLGYSLTLTVGAPTSPEAIEMLLLAFEQRFSTRAKPRPSALSEGLATIYGSCQLWFELNQLPTAKRLCSQYHSLLDQVGAATTPCLLSWGENLRRRVELLSRLQHRSSDEPPSNSTARVLRPSAPQALPTMRPLTETLLCVRLIEKCFSTANSSILRCGLTLACQAIQFSESPRSVAAMTVATILVSHLVLRKKAGSDICDSAMLETVKELPTELWAPFYPTFEAVLSRTGHFTSFSIHFCRAAQQSLTRHYPHMCRASLRAESNNLESVMMLALHSQTPQRFEGAIPTPFHWNQLRFGFPSPSRQVSIRCVATCFRGPSSQYPCCEQDSGALWELITDDGFRIWAKALPAVWWLREQARAPSASAQGPEEPLQSPSPSMLVSSCVQLLQYFHWHSEQMNTNTWRQKPGMDLSCCFSFQTSVADLDHGRVLVMSRSSRRFKTIPAWCGTPSSSALRGTIQAMEGQTDVDTRRRFQLQVLETREPNCLRRVLAARTSSFREFSHVEKAVEESTVSSLVVMAVLNANASVVSMSPLWVEECHAGFTALPAHRFVVNLGLVIPIQRNGMERGSRTHFGCAVGEILLQQTMQRISCGIQRYFASVGVSANAHLRQFGAERMERLLLSTVSQGNPSIRSSTSRETFSVRQGLFPCSRHFLPSLECFDVPWDYGSWV